ncbi:ankyrin, partial [Anaeromyces robustus]
INIQNQHGYTPLMIACYRNSEDIAKILINHEADVNKRNIYNETALMMACQYRSHLLVKLLLEKGAEVDVQNDKRGETALIIISNYYYSLDILKLLVVQGKANVNLVNKKGESPLILSCLTNNIEHINILVS